MSRVMFTAEAQLERILYILPAAARGGRVRIEDIARALDVDAATVLRDLEDATARSFYHPAGAVESFSISTDGETVAVHAPHEFRRPVRLNQREALALGLGLRTLAADAEPERRAEILELAARLEAGLTVPDVVAVREAHPSLSVLSVESTHVAEDGVEYEEFALAFDDDGFRGVIADAIELRRVCTIWYLKPGDSGPAQRSIAPYRLVYASGLWYVAALDMERRGLRFFRMDRILDARLADAMAPAAPPELDELLAQQAPYSATDEFNVRVRYSPRIARWIAERVPLAQLESDGSMVLHHRVADRRWLVRHVLQYGGEATIEEPAAARRWVSEAVAEVLKTA